VLKTPFNICCIAAAVMNAQLLHPCTDYIFLCFTAFLCISTETATGRQQHANPQ